MTDTNPIERPALDRLEEWGGERLLQQMIRLFLENSPERMTQIRDGLDGGEASVVERGAHSLKSSAANVGAHEVSRIAQLMEDGVVDGDLDGARPHHEPLVEAYQRACEALREIQKGAIP